MAFVEGKVRTVLRLEGLCILGAAVFLFAQLSGDWKLFAWQGNRMKVVDI
jgi:hypothetical protein